MGTSAASRGRSASLRRSAMPFAAFLAGALLLAASLGHQAQADEILSNGGFEAWAGAVPAGWTIVGDVTKASAPSISGSSARLGAQSTIKHQAVAAIGGATYVFSFSAQSESGNAQLSYAITFLDQDFTEIGGSGARQAGVQGSFSVQSVMQAAPDVAAYVAVQVSSVSGALFVDNASLDETMPPPTAAPTDTPTPTATFTPADDGGSSPTPTNPPQDEPTTSGGGSASTKTPTATRTPANTRTATPTKTPTNTKTPTPEKPGKTSAPTVKPPTVPGGKPPTPVPTTAGSSSFGGMLYNGDFEVDDGGKPDGWSKFGGTMILTAAAYNGGHSAELDSDTSSTKWLYQVVSVDGGAWYALDGFTSVRGAGQAFIRISWYGSDDGSGTSVDQADSDVADGVDWVSVSTGPVQAPANAHSARARLMLRPAGDASASAIFDDVEMFATDAPPPEDKPPDTTVAPSGGSNDASATPRATATGASRGTTPAANGPRIPSEPSARSTTGLRLSEFMSDPTESGQDGPFEWVELVNVSSVELNTSGWSLGDGKELDPLPARVVAPGGYVVVAGRSASLPTEVPAVIVADGQIGGGLNNTGDTLRLQAPNGDEADAISYGDDDSVFDPPPAAPPSGGTLGVRVPDSDPDADNWALTNRPTPGEPNSFAAPRAKPATAGAVADAPPAAVAPAPLVIRPASNGLPVVVWVVLGGLAAAVVVLLGFLGWDRFIASKEKAS